MKVKYVAIRKDFSEEGNEIEFTVVFEEKIGKRWKELNDFQRYIEAYEPEKTLIEFVGGDDDIADQLSLWNGEMPYPFISLRESGKLEISDAFAEAIKAKIMPKVYIETDEDLSASDVFIRNTINDMQRLCRQVKKGYITLTDFREKAQKLI